MRKKIAILGLILILGMGKLVMAEVCERIVPYGSPPDKRDGHALISSMGGNEQFLFGGFDQDADLWVLRYEGDNWRWENMGTMGTDTPSERGGHSGIFVSQGPGQDYIIVFGGSQSPLDVPVDTDTYRLDNPWDWSSEWEILETTNTVPPFRAEHTAVYEFGNKMVVFGGYDNLIAASNDTYALDFSVTPASWTKLNTSGDIPTARYGHSAVWANWQMIVFGGKDGSGDLLNDCWELELSLEDWQEPNITGDKPPARWQHIAMWMEPSPGETGGMLIFGGQGETGEYLDDFWILHTPGPEEPNYRWERIYPIGDLPSGRKGHAAGTGWGGAGERMVYIFGGYDGNSNLNDLYAFRRAEQVEQTLQEKPFNAPNPFNPDREETKICYYLDEDDDDVKIKLFTLTGDLVYSWENIPGREGLNQWPWNGRNEKGRIVENGGYICLIEAGGKKQKCKIAVLR